MVRVGGSQHLPDNGMRVSTGMNEFNFTKDDVLNSWLTPKKPGNIIVNQFNEPIKELYQELSPYQVQSMLDYIDKGELLIEQQDRSHSLLPCLFRNRLSSQGI